MKLRDLWRRRRPADAEAAGGADAPRPPERLADRPTSRLDSHQRLGSLHRVGAVVLGLGLWVFGILGLVNRLDAFSTRGEPVLGLSSNGLLSVISLVVGAVLLAAAFRGGRTASTVTVVVGAAFLASGLVNVLVLDTPLNLLAFKLPNVIFSLLAGGLLVTLGAYGRFTGRLPDDNPYERERRGDDAREVLPTLYPDKEAAAAARALAEAERATVRRAATPAQAAGVQAAVPLRRPEDRVQRWRTGGHPS